MIMRYRLVRFAAGAVLAILSGLTPTLVPNSTQLPASSPR